MKTVIGVLMVVACMIAMCYGSYQEGRFAERWDRQPPFKGDFKVEKGMEGAFGKSVSNEFSIKEAHFKIPEGYQINFDSIQIIIETDRDPIVNFCYPHWRSK